MEEQLTVKWFAKQIYRKILHKFGKVKFPFSIDIIRCIDNIIWKYSFDIVFLNDLYFMRRQIHLYAEYMCCILIYFSAMCLPKMY